MKNIKLRKFNLSIMAGLMAIGFSVSANDGDGIESVESVLSQLSNKEISKLNNVEDLERIERELEIVSRQNLSASLQKSQYRNEISELTLREQLLARQINVRNRILELRRLDYMMDLPIEAHIDRSQFNLPDDEVKKVPKINDHSLSLREYRPSTFQADQLIFREIDRSKNAVSERDEQAGFEENQARGQSSNQRRESLPQEIERAGSTMPNQRITPPSLPQREISIPQPTRQQNNESTQSMGEDGLSDAELDVLGISREEYQRWISQDLVLDASTAEIDDLGVSVEEAEETIEVYRIRVNNIFIFGENRRANVSIEYEMSDGITGERETVDYQSLEQGDVINYNGYRMRVNRITRTDVEMINDENNNRHIGTSTYR